VVGENEPQMRQALGDGTEQGVRLSYVRQTEPKGLAHAVGYAKEFVGDDAFVLYLGDAIYGSDFRAYAERFRTCECANLNIVKPVEDPSRFGVANVEGERIVRLVEKPKTPESNLAMAGMYFFRSQIWDVLPDLAPSARGEYEITDAIQILVDRGETVLAGVYEGDWFDTGTLDSFLETSRFLTGGQGAIAGDAQVRGVVGRSVVVGGGARLECASIENSVVLPGAHVKVSGAIRHSLLGADVTVEGDVEGQILYGIP
jgi:glucose-1-phosphate thymidylyltransferase